MKGMPVIWHKCQMTRMENHSQTMTSKLNSDSVGVLRGENDSIMRSVDARYKGWRRSVGVPEGKDFPQRAIVDEPTHLPEILAQRKG